MLEEVLYLTPVVLVGVLNARRQESCDRLDVVLCAGTEKKKLGNGVMKSLCLFLQEELSSGAGIADDDEMICRRSCPEPQDVLWKVHDHRLDILCYICDHLAITQTFKYHTKSMFFW